MSAAATSSVDRVSPEWPSAVDLLVVGLGPAGASAALAAAEAGLSVLAVDRHRTVGLPVQCGEYVSLHLGPQLRGSGLLRQRVRSLLSHLPGGESVCTPLQGAIIDRARFDQALAARAAAAGAMLRTGAALAGLEPGARRAHLRVGDARLVVRYGALAAADGPHSTVARLLGLPTLELLQARQYRVPLAVPTDRLRVWLSARYRGGYAWLFPRNEAANLGVGLCPAPDRSLGRLLRRLHRDLHASGLVGAEVLSRTGGAIPVSGLRQPLRLGQVVFLGDAAGLNHPVTGAGIEAAVRSGQILGRVVDDLGAFEEELRDCYQAALAHARERFLWLQGQREAGGVPENGVLRRAWVAFPDYYRPLPRHGP